MTHVANDNRHGAAAPTVMTNKEAAIFLRVSHRTLEDWRLTGRGPKFLKLGRVVRYYLPDLLDFIDQSGFDNTGEAQAA